VHHEVGPRHERVHERQVVDVAVPELEPRVVAHGRREVRQVARIGQRVEDEDPPVRTVPEDPRDEVAADEAGAAGDEDRAHGSPGSSAGPAPGARVATPARPRAPRQPPSAAAPTLDTKAFDGRYAADNTTLDINADGTYALSIDGNATDGTWTLQKGGKKVTLDPNSKGETDRQLIIESGDSVKIVGSATLKRQTDAK